MEKQFTVAIVGGGLSGLAMAIHLEALNIAWFILESRDEIAPELGASIGLSPNGMQILDQLGVHDEVVAVSGTASSVAAYDGAGAKLYDFELLPRLRATLGFEMRFLERRTLLKILHEKIRAKDRIFTGQRVARVEHVDGGVRITTREGATHAADVVIGADGIHSPVRGEMWRTAAEDGSAVFGAQPGADVATEYACIFGISDPTNDLKEGMIRQVHIKDSCIGLITGPGDVVYWFHFFKLARRHAGVDLPRFSAEDGAAIARREFHRVVNPGTTYEDVYKRKRVSVTTALPNHLFKQWHYRRIFCVGDAVCKTQPIAGQGGCSALETSVALVDALHAALEASGTRSLSEAQVDAAFATASKVRRKRSSTVVSEGMLYMKMAAWANPLLRFVDSYVVGLVPRNTLVDLMFKNSKGGYCSKTLPAPVRRYKLGSGEPVDLKLMTVDSK